jgi:hypothetical protein
MASSGAVSRSNAFDGGGGGRAGAWRAASAAMALRRRRGFDPLTAGSQPTVICAQETSRRSRRATSGHA